MKAKKIFDSDNIQGYKLTNPTKAFKKIFPKKYILSLDIMGKHEILNLDTLPNNFSFFIPLGYVFTYENSLPKMLMSNRVVYENIGSTFARCLDKYFIGQNTDESEKIDLILACGCKDKIVPPRLTEDLIIRCNSHILTGKSESRNERIKNIQNNIMKIVNSYLNDKKITVEEWAKSVIFNYPMNNNGLPVKYPKDINNQNINTFKINKSDLFVEYDFRASSYEHENNFISELEDAFEQKDDKIQIQNTYNNILDNIKRKLDEKNFPWKEIDENTIETKLKYLRDIDVEYQLTDFI